MLIRHIAPPISYPLCTIAVSPRLPEHCIEWAAVLQWNKDHLGTIKMEIPFFCVLLK